MRLRDKSIVITGAGGGIGKAMATLFASNGAKLVLGDWNEKILTETVTEIKATGAEVIGLVGNIAAMADAEQLIAAAINAYGQLDVLVNNAGVIDRNQGVGELSDEIWERVIGINLNGPMYTSRKAIQQMRKQGGGSIVNVASTAALGGSHSGAAYTTSKAALVGLTRNTAWMYTLENIRCNAICPGGTITPMALNMDLSKHDPHGIERFKVAMATMPKTLVAEDIAWLALYLASDESKCINGQIIAADHGWRAA